MLNNLTNNMILRRITLAAIAALCACACGETTEETQPVKLASNPSELTFSSEGGKQELVITTGIKPTVNCSDSWISLTEGAFADNTFHLEVNAQPNTGTTQRTSSIRVIGDKQSLMVPVTQGIAEVELTIDKTALSFDRFGGADVVKVTSAQQPTAVSNCDWCGVEVGTISDSTKETEITISAAANRTKNAKTGTVTISCGSQSVTVNLSGDAGQDTPVATTTEVTPEIAFNTLSLGWNMGNHMDAISNGVASETVWGNPKCTQATMDGVKAAGFKSVRICTTWEGHIGPGPAYIIEEKWMSRVEEIVGYAEKAGLVAILNTHHDESYWQDISKCYNNTTQNEKVKDEIFCFWTQVANRFKEKGEWLMFESFNEIQDGGWGYSSAFLNNPDVQYKVLNDWNQVFVDAVRSTGGNNATRWLGVPGYCASPTFTMAGLTVPNDYTSANRILVAVHDYDPYEYTIKDPMLPRFGHTAESGTRPNGDNEAGLRYTFGKLKETYVDKGIPMYLGEFGCSRHNTADLPYQKYYMEYFCKAAADSGFPMLLWDNGATGTGPEHHPYIDHGTGKFVDQTAKELVEIMVKAVTSTDPAYTLESVYNSAP